MIRTVVVDDERLAIKELVHHLGAYEAIEVVATFMDAREALDYIKKDRPELMFLDINMPGMTGIEAAGELLDIDPGIRVVFVTAYDEYALEAFEVFAFDYIVKPIVKERLAKTIQRISSRLKKVTEEKSQQLFIRTFGGFEIGFEGMDGIRFRTVKTRELLAFILHNRFQKLNKDVIIANLWPDQDPDKAKRQLYNGVYYIRKALMDYGISMEMITIGVDYGIKLKGVAFDVEILEESVRKSECDPFELRELYKGDYLAFCNWDWAMSEQEALKSRYINCVLKGIDRLQLQDDYDSTVELLKHLYQLEPFEERISRKLVEVYESRGDRNKAFAHYEEYAELIDRELGIMPEEDFQDMMKYI